MIYAHQVRLDFITTDLPKNLCILLEKHVDLGIKRRIIQVGPYTFTVSPLASQKKPDKSNRIVDLQQQTCSCGQWQEMKFPCLHAAGVLRAQGKHFDLQYIDSRYQITELKQAFSRLHTPIDMESIEADGVTMLTSVLKKRGRPRTKRLRSRSEHLCDKQKRCSTCGQKGHYSTTCVSSTPGLKKQRKRTCSACKQVGHNRVTCQNRVLEHMNN